MEILKIIGLSIGSIIILFILTKIMGQREMSQLSIFTKSSKYSSSSRRRKIDS